MLIGLKLIGPFGPVRVITSFHDAVVCSDVLHVLGCASPENVCISCCISNDVFQLRNGMWVTLNLGGFIRDAAMQGLVPQDSLMRLHHHFEMKRSRAA